MLRQTFRVPSRALRSATRSISQRPLSRPQTFIAPFTLRTIQPTAARWYSDAPKESQEQTKTEDGAEAQPAAESPEAAENPEVAELKKQLEAKTKEVAEWKDKCLRTVADFRNLQDRTQREIKNAREFAITGFAKDLVDSVDNLDRALSMVPTEKLAPSADENAEKPEGSEDLAELYEGLKKDLSNLYDGLKMTDDILQNTIKKHGLERFDPTGEKFNPNEHEATFMQAVEGKENNTVLYVQQKGFKLNGRVLRAAKVGVVKNP